jgi:SAM-dependent methyltransferase
MSKGSVDVHHLHFNEPGVVRYYADLEELQPGEQYLFDKYVRDDMTVLDIGVGGGRTTPYLADKAKRYIGIDYSQRMVDACRSKFGCLQFETMDATDLSAFHDDAFDLVLFTYNGIDCLGSDAARARCLSEIRRVLKPGGMFIFSSHNARGGVLRPLLRGASPMRKFLRIGYALWIYSRTKAHLMRSGVFFRGSGYSFDPTHGGGVLYACTPEVMTEQTQAAGFDVVEIVEGTSAALWYYYVLAKPGATSCEAQAR